LGGRIFSKSWDDSWDVHLQKREEEYFIEYRVQEYRGVHTKGVIQGTRSCAQLNGVIFIHTNY